MADNPLLSGGSGGDGGGGNPLLGSSSGSSSGGGSGWLGSHGAGRKKKHKHRGGILGTISRIPGDTARGAYHAALNIPGGIKQFSEAEWSAIQATINDPWISRDKALEAWQHPLRPVEGTANTPQITEFGKANLEGLKTTVQHPLRDPFQTAMLALPLASGAAKVGIAGRAAYTGVPAAETRTLSLGNAQVHPELSRSGLGQAMQLTSDKLLQSAAAKNPTGLAAKRLETRIGKVTTAQARQAERIAKGPANAVAALGRKLSPGEQKALEVFAEKAPLQGRIEATQARIDAANDLGDRARHEVELDLLRQAAPHLLDEAPPAGAVYSKPVVHITTPESAAGIRGGGFDVNRGKGLGGDDYGPGIYLADEASDMGAFWRSEFETKDPTGIAPTEAMKGHVALNNPFEYEYQRWNNPGTKVIGRISPRQALEQHRPDLVSRFDEAARSTTERRAFGQVLRDAGYDGIVIPHRAGDEIVAFDRSRVSFGGATPQTRLASPKLQKVFDRMQKVAGTREDLFKGFDLLTDEAIQGRKTKAGRVSLGAGFEPATPGKLGEPSPALIRQQAYSARLSTLAERARTKAAEGELSDMQRKQAGEILPASEREFDVQGELDAVNRKIAELRKHLPADSPEIDALVKVKTAWGKVEEGRQHMEAAAQRVEGADVPTPEQIAAKVEELKATIRDMRGHGPEVQALKKAIRKLDAQANKLRKERRRLEQGSRRMPSGVVHTAGGARLEPKGYQRAERLSAAESVAKDRTLQMQEAAARRVQPTGVESIAHLRHAELRVKKVTQLLNRTKPDSKRRTQLEAQLVKEQANLDRLQLVRERGGLTFNAPEGAVRIPDATTRKGRKQQARLGQVGSQGVIGNPLVPGSVKHEYTGALRESGHRKQYTGYFSRGYSPTAQVAESGVEAAKYAGLRKMQDFARKAASPIPRHDDDLAVRLDDKTAPLDPAVREFVNDPEQFFATATPEEAIGMFDKVRESVVFNPKTLDPAKAAEFQKLHAEGKIGWVPKRALGDLAKPSSPLSSLIGKKPVATLDAINNAQRLAILYLKPAYALPNLLGNATLNVLQQGYAAPQNLAKAVWLNRIMGPELAARIHAAMGEGFAEALSAHGAGRGARVADFAARFWSKGVDQPFRTASFLFEAGRKGYKTPKQLEDLLTNPAKVDELTDISITANREIIDYAALSNREKETIRRVVFFYPWVKGSTVYTGRMLREHPAGSAVLATLGARGYEQYKEDFPDAPSWWEGSIKVGDRVVNPAAASIFGTPAQVGRVGADILTGRMSDVGEAGSMLTPALSLEEALRTRRGTGGYQYPSGTSPLDVAKAELVEGTPQWSLAMNLLSKSRGDHPLFPPSPLTGAARFGVGGLYPRPYDPKVLAKRGKKERSRLGD